MWRTFNTHLKISMDTYWIMNIEMEISVIETGVKSLAKQACHGRRQPLYPNSVRTGTSNSRFRSV